MFFNKINSILNNIIIINCSSKTLFSQIFHTLYAKKELIIEIIIMIGVRIINIKNYEKLDKKIDVNNEKFYDIMYLYSQALKELEKKINIIKIDYEYEMSHSSIDHIKVRMKSSQSILNKMKKDKLKCTYKNMIENINDIAGIRIITPLKSDIFIVRNYIREINDIKIIKEKDYVSKPKESGYASYHIIVELPVIIDKEINSIKAEIQIRSLAMDFWASLEHTIQYKPNGEINKDVSKSLVECAKEINELDEKMITFFNI